MNITDSLSRTTFLQYNKSTGKFPYTFLGSKIFEISESHISKQNIPMSGNKT